MKILNEAETIGLMELQKQAAAETIRRGRKVQAGDLIREAKDNVKQQQPEIDLISEYCKRKQEGA